MIQESYKALVLCLLFFIAANLTAPTNILETISVCVFTVLSVIHGIASLFWLWRGK